MERHGRVGPYRIHRLIKRGGQGNVYLGYDGRLQRRVAIKIYRMPNRRSARRTLLREAQAVASLDNQRIVAVHDIIESREHLALVMEYVPGCDLGEYLEQVRPSLASVVTVGQDIASGLAVARQQAIVHGDLKPANVLITAGGRTKLTDFGIAQHDAARQGSAGSLSALSPEQCLGEALDVRTDLFALGCVLYRMLGGEAPFHSGGKLDIQWLLERPPAPLSALVPPEMDVPEELVELVMRVLSRNPQLRPGNTHEVRQVLREVKRSLPLSRDSSLLREARPCFRQDAPGDIPLEIPTALGSASRSRLSRAGIWSSWLLWSWPRRLFASLALLGLVATPVVIALQERETIVHIDAPVMEWRGAAQVPEEVSAAWLVEQAKRVLGRELGNIRVRGPIGATPDTVFRAGVNGDPGEPVEKLQIQLQCSDGLCAFAVGRDREGQLRYRQALLLDGMTLEQWTAIVSEATAALYD